MLETGGSEVFCEELRSCWFIVLAFEAAVWRTRSNQPVRYALAHDSAVLVTQQRLPARQRLGSPVQGYKWTAE